VFHPKGVWCLEDCRKGFMKRPGLNERQAVLLRGKRELVITAESIDDLKEWNRAVQEAAKITQRNLNEVQRSADAELSKLRSHWDSMLVELEVTRSKLREEREARARMQLEADSAQIDNAQLAQQEKALLHAQLELQNREEQMRTQLESEKRKLSEERKLAEEERMREAAGEQESNEEQMRLMEAQMEELRQQLHKEIDARRAADILKEAAIKAQLDMEDKQNDLHWQVEQLHLQAAQARENAKTLQHVSEEATKAARTSSAKPDQGREAAEAEAAATAAAEAVEAAQAKTAEAEAAREQLEQEADLPVTPIIDETKAALGHLKKVCSRLSRIERPEATLLYAEMMNARAKLVHAQEWLVDHQKPANLD